MEQEMKKFSQALLMPIVGETPNMHRSVAGKFQWMAVQIRDTKSTGQYGEGIQWMKYVVLKLSR
jgi:hypothetical protein